MTHRRSAAGIAAAFALTAVLTLVASCKPATPPGQLWPTATSDRVVPQPPPTPRWPLTGQVAPSQDAIRIRVVSVKVENSPEARPQTGLDKADIVYETVTEGGITRFNALFQSQTPAAVGPVRSARPSDFAIVPQYRALFAHCGADSKVQAVLRDHTRFNDMDQFYNPGPYFRSNDRPAPHNLYCDIAKLRTAAVRNRGYAAALDVQGLAFLRSAIESTPSASTIEIPFSLSNRVSWRYDAAANAYLRSINGRPHVDKASGKQYSARNVVVLWARVSNYVKGSHGQVVEIQLTGSGRASVFRGGARLDGTWQASDTAPPTFRAADGTAIELNPGNTWFQVIEVGQKITAK